MLSAVSPSIASSPSATTGSKSRRNWTLGSTKPFTAAKGTTSFSGMPLKERLTEKDVSVTSRSQNWCWMTTVISSG